MSTSNPSNPNLTYANYAQYVSQTLLADRVGSQAGIPNALATSQLNTAILTDPEQIKAYRLSAADQMNAQTAGPRFEDLSERIADIVWASSAQGASTLEVHIDDPMWALIESGFVQTDELGYLWPPIEIRFPSDTNCKWRLVSLRASLQPSQQGNLIFTFEDRIVSDLRQMSPLDGIYQGLPNQTLGGFFQMLVDNTNQTLKSDVKLVQLIDPVDPNYVTPITSTGHQNALRKNPSKVLQGLTQAQQAVVGGVDAWFQNAFGGVKSLTFQQAEALNGPTAGQVGSADYIPNASYIPGLN